MTGELNDILDVAAELNPVVLCLITVAFTVAETSLIIGLLVPGDAMVAFAAAGVGSPLGFAGVVVSGLAGCLAGQSLGYLLGRKLGPRVARSRVGRRLGAHRWARVEGLLRQGGGPVIAGSRFMPVVHALVPVIAGIIGMPYRQFVLWAVVGAAPWSALFAGIGAAAGASVRQGDGPLLPLVFAGIGVVIGGMYLLRTGWRMKKRGAEAERETAPLSSVRS